MTSITAGPLFRSVTGILILRGIYIHDLDYEGAQQWISVLQEIPKEGEE